MNLALTFLQRHWWWLACLIILADATTHGGIMEPNWR